LSKAANKPTSNATNKAPNKPPIKAQSKTKIKVFKSSKCRRVYLPRAGHR